MNRSTAAQSPPKRIGWLRILLLAATALFAIWFVRAYEGEAQQYRLYLTEDRPAITLAYEELSGDWTEQSLKARFPENGISCSADAPPGIGDRACALNIVSNNGVPTMYIAFFFAGGRLNAATFNVPWWAHGDALDNIVATYGEPYSAQLLPRGGVRLLGWKLPGGGALFYNRDRDINPLIWNSAFWNSPAFCARNGCFTE